MRGLQLSGREFVRGSAILAAGCAVMWAFMIRPYSFDWQPSGEVTGQVKTLMSNSNVIGAAHIKAVIITNDGTQTIVEVPLRSNIRAGSHIILSVQADAENPKRKRYIYKSASARGK